LCKRAFLFDINPVNKVQMKRIGFILILALFSACNSQPSLEISVEDIDIYVAEKLDESQIYDVTQSLRFSRNDETYEVVQYLQNDSVVLYLETLISNEENITRQVFFKEGFPIYVSEYISKNTEITPFSQREVYLDGASVIEARERLADNESDLEYIEYQKIALEIDVYDFSRLENAILQKGEFEMKFGEFIVINPQSYLILENTESDYEVALFITEEHPVLDELFDHPEENKGRSIFVNHQFVSMSGIERMLFIDGFFKEEEETAEAN